MRVGIFIPEEPDMHVETLSAFADGMKRLDIEHQVYDLAGGWRRCDVAVTFGIAKQANRRGKLVGKIAARQKSYGGRHLVIERGFVRRDRYFMVGWDGLNGRADFCNESMPADRWNGLRVEVKPWRTAGAHIVLCGQVPWDASVQHSDHRAWCRRTALSIGDLTDRPIQFRPHPMQPTAIDMAGTDVIPSPADRLEDALEDAWCVVTYNSNAAVEAAILGTPVFAFDEGSMAWPIANRELDLMATPSRPDRQDWLSNLAYTQWTNEEIAHGDPWLHLTRHGAPRRAPWQRRLACSLLPFQIFKKGS